MSAGWIRHPTIAGDVVIFVSDDDLWVVDASGGTARRLTTGLGRCANPRLSADGSLIAFDGSEEGVRDVYVLDQRGGAPRRLTWDGVPARVVGWTPDGRVVYASAAGRPFGRDAHLHVVHPEGGQNEPLPWGPAQGISYGPDGQLVLCRHQHDLAWWKGYRGGRTGALWLQRDGRFERLDIAGNVASPTWVGDRIAFAADVEGGDPQLWSVAGDGSDLRCHSDHADLAVRFPSSDGSRLVYVHGGDLWRWDGEGAPEQVPVEVTSQRTSLQRKFPSATRYLEGYDAHPDGHSLALTVRGRLFVMGHFEGPVRQSGARDGVRYRLPRWIDNERLLCTSDAGGEEALEVHHVWSRDEPDRLDLPIGRAISIEVDPTGKHAAVADHRNQLWLVELDGSEARCIDSSTCGVPSGLAWSVDGRWLAWSRPEAMWGSRASIQLLDVHAGDELIALTPGQYRDTAPSFDPDGEHLYFLSSRVFDPVLDTQHFAYAFPRGTKPFAVTLRAPAPHPFRPNPGPLKRNRSRQKIDVVHIDVDGLTDRIAPFPVAEGRYQAVLGAGAGKVLMVRAAVRGTLNRSWRDAGPPKVDRELLQYDFEKAELTSISPRISSVRLDRSKEHAVVRVGWKLRVIPSRPDRSLIKEELKKTDGRAGRKGMWVGLDRIRVSVDPGAEWRQMVGEAWRLMRDHYWREGIPGVDWEKIRERYIGLVGRVATRSELSDLVWCMQGELRTSHAYELGGDHRAPPVYRVGYLGADLGWDDEAGGWRVERIVRGEPGDPARSSPLCAPGASVQEGDVIVAFGGVPAAAEVPVQAALVHQAGALVELDLVTEHGPRRVVVSPLRSETPLRYRDWVLANRRRVHEATDGQVGYVHVPDMGPGGFAEFHRDYHAESAHDAMLVDVRWNGGGHVSQLLLDLLGRRRLGYKVPRWGTPVPYPASSVVGPMVCLTNEMAGSDGDIFSHAWKLMELGPLIGTRTWGGVVGISPRNKLVDKAITTQPEFSTWFSDVGYGLENHGTDVDEEVLRTPDDWAARTDTQLERGIACVLEALETSPVEPPDLGR